MKVRLEERFQRNGYDVWIYERRGDHLLVHRPIDGELGGDWVADEWGTADDPPPSFFIPEPLLKALVAEASDHLPPSAATDRHLDDAIKVRDRLLTLVELGVPGGSS